jgi:hypothetical protein
VRLQFGTGRQISQRERHAAADQYGESACFSPRGRVGAGRELGDLDRSYSDIDDSAGPHGKAWNAR